MSKKATKYIHLIYSIVLSVMLIFAGISLIVACVGIYLSGDKPFSPEAVSIAFSGIAIPVYLCIALIVIGFVLDGFLPGSEKKPSFQKQHKAILDRLYAKTDVLSAEPHIYRQIRAMQARRKLFKYITLGLLAVCSVIFLIYGLNSKHFHQSEITDSMINAMKVFIPCLAVPFGFGVFCAYYERFSLNKEIELVKQLIAAGIKAEPQAQQPRKNHKGLFLALRLGLLAVGIVIVVYGFLTGGTQDVLTKAINICTECVGLG